jgi:(4-O-methyl)-D-glucuronate---lignin esterase
VAGSVQSIPKTGDKMKRRILFCVTLAAISTVPLDNNLLSRSSAQEPAQRVWVYNADESKVVPYTLPDPLILQNGKPVRDAATWFNDRRPEILHLFETQVFGRSPTIKLAVRYVVTSVDKNALGGLAIRKQVTAYFTNSPEGPAMRILIFLPAHAAKPVPVFAALNFGGNQTVNADPGIDLNSLWVPDALSTQGGNPSAPTFHEHAGEKTRGSAEHMWQVEKIISRGYALATANYGDIEPDFAGGISRGVRPLFFAQGQTEPVPDEWGAEGAWAWGLSRIADYLETEKDIDGKKISVMGHSRLGRAALWAGAQDSRFAIVISNESGKAGASLYRRSFGEPIAHLNIAFPHWFCGNFHQYTDHDDKVPVDGHMLLALVAPRPVYVASAEDNAGADPRGEFLGAVAAGPVYELLGKNSLGTNQWPQMNHPIMKTIGYHLRTGKHDVTEYDWEQYLNFADMHFGKINEH